MLGITTRTSTDTNQLNISIPDELKGIELQVIILPATKDTEQKIEFFSDTELQQLPTLQLSTDIEDNEDYSKW